MLLAIDPGVDAGWALFEKINTTQFHRLVACGLGAPPDPTPPGACPVIDRLFVERPMIYPGGRQKARPRDIITLAVRAGEAAGPFRKTGASIEYVEPAEWKRGSIPKDIHHARLWAKLAPSEQAIVSAAATGVAPSKRHNIMDAVGIGLFAVAR